MKMDRTISLFETVNHDMLKIIRRGFSSLVQYNMLKDAIESKKNIVNDYGLKIVLEPGKRSDIVLNGSVDSKKTIKHLVEQSVHIPTYFRRIIQDFPRTMGYETNRAPVFYLSDDIQTEGMVAQTGMRLEPKITYIVDNWDFTYFKEGENVKKLILESFSGVTGRGDIRNITMIFPETLSQAIDVMDIDGIVHNLFSDNIWIENAVLFSRSLISESLQKLEKMPETENYRNSTLYLLSHYLNLIQQ